MDKEPINKVKPDHEEHWNISNQYSRPEVFESHHLVSNDVENSQRINEEIV